jgi:outer membrane receptor protein involved in Fe transport
MYEHRTWRAALYARYITSYQDRSSTTGEPLPTEVRPGTVWDLNVSRSLTDHVSLTLGAVNVTNRAPPYANVGGALGFDNSQGDLEGREFFLTLNGNF